VGVLQTAGKAVVVVNVIGSGAAGSENNDADLRIFFVDTTADELSGLSVNDITYVGVAADIYGSGLATVAVSGMFVG